MRMFNKRGQGSSPRVRGKPDIRSVPSNSTRLIPACAGKTIAGFAAHTFLWAHPRVCGENEIVLSLSAKGAGSSPRVRGKPQAVSRGLRAKGLIPACAGKT